MPFISSTPNGASSTDIRLRTMQTVRTGKAEKIYAALKI